MTRSNAIEFAQSIAWLMNNDYIVNKRPDCFVAKKDECLHKFYEYFEVILFVRKQKRFEKKLFS